MAYITVIRPKLVTWICILGFVLVVFSMPAVFSPETRRMGDFFPAIFALLISLRFIAYVGLWHMKRWGVELFLITFAAQLIQGILMDDFSVVGTIYHIIITVLLALQYRKMDRNL